MLLKFKDNNILLKMSEEDRNTFISIIESINQKTQILKDIIININNPNLKYNFHFHKIFDDSGINIFSIFIYNIEINFLSNKFKTQISKIENQDIQYLNHFFDFNNLKKEIKIFQELERSFKQKYITEPFQDNINKLNKFLPKKYNKEILRFQIIYTCHLNSIYFSIDFHHLNINNIEEKKEYTLKYFSNILFFFNINIEEILHSMIQKNEPLFSSSYNADIVFEKLSLFENINNF